MKKFALLAVLCAPLGAQWLKQPTAGIPRTPDGKPHLSAPVPKAPNGKPDLTGLWRINVGAFGGNAAAELKSGEVLPWAEALYKQRLENLGTDHMGVQCLPFGPGYVNAGGLAKFVQTPGLLVILYEDLSYRQIFLDGRDLPKDPNPSWMGYSVGRWDGDTLVVESFGFNDRTWIDFGGHPHTEELRITERFHRKDFGHMDLEITWNDPKAYTRPWSVKATAEFAADTDLLEYVCKENEKDLSAGHLVGKLSDDRKYAVKVAPEVLSRYIGSYDFNAPDLDLKMVLNITLVDNELKMDISGNDPQPLIPTSEKTFLGVGTKIEFVADDTGRIDHMKFEIVEGEYKAIRRK
jgi:hypothetical protein